MGKPVVRVAVTGGAGQIAYQLLFRLARGELLGEAQPISLRLLDIPEVLTVLEGVKMELEDCLFPLLHEVRVTTDPCAAFADVDIALLIGAKPRVLGMERGDLLQENGKIFVEQGRALNEVASLGVRVFVVGNPCNTNCLIAMSHAPRLSPTHFYAMTRLDQNRAVFFLAQKAEVPLEVVSRVAIWGNHSSTQVPDLFHARLRGLPVETFIDDRDWLDRGFITQVRERGAAIIRARGKSSAGSAAQAILDAVHDVLSPTGEGRWFSSGVIAKGNPYGIDEGLIFSFPCRTLATGEVAVVSGLEMPAPLIVQLRMTERELIEERDQVRSLFNRGLRP